MLAELLRREGHRVELDGRGGSLKSMLRRANGMAARLCLLMGETELLEGRVQCKDLARHEQLDVGIDDLQRRVAELLALPAQAASGDGDRSE